MPPAGVCVSGGVCADAVVYRSLSMCLSAGWRPLEGA